MLCINGYNSLREISSCQGFACGIFPHKASGVARPNAGPKHPPCSALPQLCWQCRSSSLHTRVGTPSTQTLRFACPCSSAGAGKVWVGVQMFKMHPFCFGGIAGHRHSLLWWALLGTLGWLQCHSGSLSTYWVESWFGAPWGSPSQWYFITGFQS